MITIVGISTSAAKAVTKLDKDKYQLLLLFGDCFEPRFFKDFDSFLIGRHTLGYKGTGGYIERGKQAMEESLNEILSLIKGDEVIIVCYSGGGMSGGLSTLVSGLLNQGKRVSIITSIPAEFEGPNRLNKSGIVIDNLHKLTNDIHIIEYREVLENLDKKETVISFYRKCDDIVFNEILELIKKAMS